MRTDLGAKHALRERRKDCLHRAVGTDNGRHAGVGRAQHRATGFDSAHAGDLQVLRLGQRASEPGSVRQVGKNSGLWQGADDKAGVTCVIADVDFQLLADYCK